MEAILRFIFSTAVFAAAICFTATPALATTGDQKHRQQIHAQLVRYYHAQGVVRSIGRQARRTIYTSDPVSRQWWRSRVRRFIRIRDDAKRKLAALRAPPVPWTPSWLMQATCVHGKEGAWIDNTGNGYFGGMQFTLSTWKRAGGGDYPSFHHPGSQSLFPFTASVREQLYRAWIIWKDDGGSWREWGTAPACGLA